MISRGKYDMPAIGREHKGVQLDEIRAIRRRHSEFEGLDATGSFAGLEQPNGRGGRNDGRGGKHGSVLYSGEAGGVSRLVEGWQ